ncbi:MAG TPA: AlpA family transcriptional regulator [Bacillota bacterium]|nr:AlpA family transcriptional regulator [Bacillota bacterium]
MDRIIRKKELLKTIGLSGVTIWRMERAGTFPKRIKLGGNSVGWYESEIIEWMEKKRQDRI